MDSITASPDRVAQVISGSGIVHGGGGAGDSVVVGPVQSPLQMVEQTATGISAAEIVYENRQQFSSVSEGVASAGHPNPETEQVIFDRMDEWRPPAGAGPSSVLGEGGGGVDTEDDDEEEHATNTVAYGKMNGSKLNAEKEDGRYQHGNGRDTRFNAMTAEEEEEVMGYEGETSGGVGLGASVEAAGESNGYAEGPGNGVEVGTAMPGASVGYGPTTAYGATEAPSEGIRGDVDDQRGGGMDFQGTTSDVVGQVPHTGEKRKNYGDGELDTVAFESKRPEANLNRVPSDLAMVTGMSDGEGEDAAEMQCHHGFHEPCDSSLANIAPGVAAAATAADETAQNPMIGEVQNRPTDAEIIDWENRVREDEVANRPLIGDIEPLESLIDEYRYGSSVFLAKINSLKNSYKSIRRTRGDGNCFFRSFLFAYLENMVTQNNVQERDAAISRFNDLKTTLISVGYEELVLETPLELLLELLKSIGCTKNPLTVEILELKMRSEDISNYIVFLLRIITSAEIKRRADFFAPFVMVRARHFSS